MVEKVINNCRIFLLHYFINIFLLKFVIFIYTFYYFCYNKSNLYYDYF